MSFESSKAENISGNILRSRFGFNASRERSTSFKYPPGVPARLGGHARLGSASIVRGLLLRLIGPRWQHQYFASHGRLRSFGLE